MAKSLLALYMTVTTLAGPWLCCCVVTSKVLAAQAGPCDTSPDDCPCCKKIKNERSPAPAPMPCRCRADLPVAILPAKDILNSLDDHDWLFEGLAIEPTIQPVDAGRRISAAILKPPLVISVRRRLSLLSVLNC